MAKKIRIECEQRNRAGQNLKDLRTGQAAFFHRGEAVLLELGLFANGQMMTKADVTTITVKFFSDANEEVLTQNFENSQMSASVTADQWRNGNGCLAALLIGGGDTNNLPAGFFTMQVKANQGGLGDTIFAYGKLEGVTLPTYVAGVPVDPGPDEYWTKDEADARFAFPGDGASQDDVDALMAFTGATPESTDYGNFLKYTEQTLADGEAQVARANINAAVEGGLTTIIGVSSGLDLVDSRPNAATGAITKVTPGVNTAIELRAPTLLPGTTHILAIQQGFVVSWTADYAFPDYEITCGAATGDFTKKTWHPATGEGYDRFTLVNDGTVTHVRRFRSAARPHSIIDFEFNRPFSTGTGSTITTQYERDLKAATTGFTGSAVTYGSLTGSGIGAGVFSANGDVSFAVPQIPYAQGYSIAVVFEATAGSADKVLFRLGALGVDATMQTSGGNNIRFKPIGSAATAGIPVSVDFGVPVAAVIVVRAGSASAFVLSTSINAGGNTGSFTPAAASGTTGYFGGNNGTNYITGKIARWRLISTALTPDQARAELDALTAAYKIG